MSYAFAFNAVGFFGASQFAAVLGKKYGAYVVMRRAIIGFCLMAFSLLSATLLGGASLYVTMGGLFLTFGCLGLVLPTAMVLALDKRGAIAGLASSLGGGVANDGRGLRRGSYGAVFHWHCLSDDHHDLHLFAGQFHLVAAGLRACLHLGL